MNETERTQIFAAQQANVLALERAWKYEYRHLNDAIRQNNGTGIEVTTKVLAVLYCGLAEATFSKLIHLPRGLDLAEIDSVKLEQRNKGVKPGWLKCVEFASSRLSGDPLTDLAKVRQTVGDLINKWIFDPSVMRNRLAHGQWTTALNGDNTAVNVALTQEIATVDSVELARRKLALEKLSRIIEDMIMSPYTAHRRDFAIHVRELADSLSEMSTWTLLDKATFLKRKPKKKPTS